MVIMFDVDRVSFDMLTGAENFTMKRVRHVPKRRLLRIRSQHLQFSFDNYDAYADYGSTIYQP